jgi:acetyl esterase
VLHPQAVAVAELWAQDASVADGVDVVAQRAQDRAAALADDAGPAVDTVLDVDADGVACRLYRPAEGAPVVVHLHGGGFVFGDLETHDAHSRRLAVASGWAVLAVDYRLAPEHTYPAASDDVDTVVDWLGAHGSALGVDNERLSVVGDSAGGQLALVAALRRPVFSSLGLVYPCLDPTGGYPSFHTETGGLDAAEMSWFWNSYLGGATVSGNPELAPLQAPLSRLPRTLVITAEHDPLRDEGEALAAGIAAAGVRCVGTRYLGMIHGFFRHPDLFDASTVAMEQVATWLGSAAAT